MKKVPILIAEDDEDDRFLIQAAFEDCGIAHPLVFARDGIEVMQYLLNQGAFANKEAYPRPALVLLDLNMPKKDGRETIKEIRNQEAFKTLPIIVLSTSNAPQDLKICYESGANCFINKPSSFEGLLDTVKGIYDFWFRLALLPR